MCGDDVMGGFFGGDCEGKWRCHQLCLALWEKGLGRVGGLRDAEKFSHQ